MKKGARKTKKKAAKQAKTPTKKQVKRKTVKKPVNAKRSAKPKIEVTIRKNVLGKAPQEHHFVLQDGRTVKTVYQLVDELETMSEEMFRHHVNDFKNDFANWIEHVFDEKHLADEMRYIEDRLDTQRAILKELVRTLTKARK